MYTSLVFLVVLGMWAAYLVQHSMRRREQLLTARSVDAFTEALRVLERRPQSTTTPRSHAAGPLQSAAPTGSTATRAARHARRADTSTRMRVAGLLTALTLVVVTVLTTLAGLTGVLLPLAATALLLGDLTYLRFTAAAVTRPVVARPAAARPGVEATQAPVEPPAPQADVVDVVAQPEVVVRPRTSPALFDVRSFEEPAAAPAPEEPPAPGTWRPTPVPAPLYTRKPVVLAPAPARPVLEPVLVEEVDADLLDMPSPFARVVNG